MPLFAEPPAGPFDPVPLLKDFLDDVRNLLEQVLREGRLLDERYLALAREAYLPIPAQIAAMKDRLYEPHVLGRLEEHGLTGAGLRFKLTLISHQHTAYLQAPRQPARGIFKKLLEFIDNLLESLVEALGLGGAVVEFKKAIEGATPDDFGEI